MNKTFKLERAGRTCIAIIRQMPHDTLYSIGDKIKYGGGPKWTVAGILETIGDYTPAHNATI